MDEPAAERSTPCWSSQPGAGPSTHPSTHSHPQIPTLPPIPSLVTLPFHPSSPVCPHIPCCAAHPLGYLHPNTGCSLPSSPRVQTCTLPCTSLPTVHSTVPRALARAIQGLVWGAKALLSACPLTCEEERGEQWDPANKHIQWFTDGEIETQRLDAQ